MLVSDVETEYSKDLQTTEETFQKLLMLCLRIFSGDMKNNEVVFSIKEPYILFQTIFFQSHSSHLV